MLCIMDTMKQKYGKSEKEVERETADRLCLTFEKYSLLSTNVLSILLPTSPFLSLPLSNASPDVRSASERFCGLLTEH